MTDRTIAPEIRPFKNLSIPYPQETRLKNGVILRSLDVGEMPVNRLSFSWEGGMTDWHNPAALSIMMNLLREGTETISGGKFSELLDYHGAWLRTEPLSHNVYASLYSMNSSFERLLPTFIELFQNPALPEQEFMVIREKIAAATENQLKKVCHMASVEDKRRVFGHNHPLAMTQTPDEIRAAKHSEIVEAFVAVVKNIRPTVYFTGKTDKLKPKLIESIESLDFSGNAYQTSIIAASPETPGTKKVKVENAMQSAVAISMPTIDRKHNDYIELRFAVMALGGYFGSRLMKNIREDKGYTYGITANLLGYHEGGVVNIQSETDDAYVDALIEETRKEIARLASNPMDADELHAVKNHAMTSLAYYLDSPFSIMDHHITHYHQNTPDRYFEKQIEALNSLTSERISELIATYLHTDKMLVTVAGK